METFAANRSDKNDSSQSSLVKISNLLTRVVEAKNDDQKTKKNFK